MTTDSRRDDISNTLRILVATDCHLGYMEKDEIRRHDSFQAFDEICSIAEEKQVDFLLLGGDLFHENKPSRSTLVKAIEILRRHCLNDQPVQFQVVSDQTVNFPNTFGHVNYEDPHFNVGLPVFSIHGNHDDPAGVDNLSAVDILSACNLVNYFGKMVLGGSGVGQITLYPILIRKGSTAVALYGLGNIRDERLNRMFQTPHAVQWMRPEPQEGYEVSDWFNILALHQNRVKMNPKNAINERFLPRFLDFVVWGHEHECLIDPQEVPGMGFHISQPGSSVATSLIDGESKPKHVLLLEIKGNQYRPTKIPLTSVRPFEYTEVVLKDEPDIDPNDQNSILEYLDKVVSNLIEKSSRKAVNGSDLKLPLVRVKVDYSGFMTINPQRFGQKYVGKVANPQDILIFSKASKRSQKEAKIDDSERLRPEELNQQNIEALVAENNLKMEILPVNDLDVALHNFVNKDDKLAFYNCVQYNLEETRNKIGKDSDASKFEEEDLILKVGECLEERVKERSSHPKDALQFTSSVQSFENVRSKNDTGVGSAASFSDDEDTAQLLSSANRGRKGSLTASRSSRDAPEVSKSKTSTRGRGRGRGRGSSGLKQTTLDATLGFRHSQRSASVAAAAAVQSIADDEENIDSASSEEYGINEVDNSSENDEIVQGKGRKRAAPRGRGRGSTSKRGRKSDNSSVHKVFVNKHDDDDDDDDTEEIARRFNKSQPRVTKSYGALRR
ncbi:double-strand break repair protein MRE11 [Durio zibethinus]|uniref:Double-strand break repair protein n=1 Tax=Durio zibethinus TaxID=66656 RepID=A0A6P5ZK10_DURZI|nr:double-strand break repair protein MRE11 [Durio zibethinus]XP_022753229.1 double-strand break repair protein MRE11 [Durio zibethinus]XP_022753230.1 double-strand break repair protein MRE11 [Durio zibethinus]